MKYEEINIITFPQAHIYFYFAYDSEVERQHSPEDLI